MIQHAVNAYQSKVARCVKLATLLHGEEWMDVYLHFFLFLQPHEKLHLDELVPESFEHLGEIFRRVFGS